ncbi:MAG TPA: DUF4846 domain-containing protein, partial [Spirochaetota bacterium]|nr:DUF4846 domain-containing protein [Spirochaetota bacterium]
MTVKERFLPPKGYSRIKYEDSSFARYLSDLPLKPAGALVKYYNGAVKAKEDIYLAVVDFDLDPVNLQQCADAVIRLRAEYLYAAGSYDAIGFSFVNGFVAEYREWMKGKRIRVLGNRVSWIKTANASNDYRSFRKYLLTVFNYAGTASLPRDMVKVKNIRDISAGDVFLKPGYPGHAVIVIDTAVNAKNEKVFILAQSYMPAQDIQILVNPADESISPWYAVPKDKVIKTPEWIFSIDELMRFKEK